MAHMTEAPTPGQAASTTQGAAIFSMSMFLILSIVCLYHLQQLQRESAWKQRAVRRLFHVILIVTCLMELPQWLVCSAVPKCRSTDDMVAGRFYLWTYAVHLVAVVGYLACLAITMSLWTDVLGNEDHVESTYREDMATFCRRSTRKPGRAAVLIFFFLYTALNVATGGSLLTANIRFGTHGDVSFAEWAEHDTLYSISAVVEPVALLLMASFFLVHGLRLQCHVLRAGQLFFVIVRLNLAVSVVVVFYFFRAILVLAPMAHVEAVGDWVDEIETTLWSPFLSLWGPFGVGSGCLVFIMRPLHDPGLVFTRPRSCLASLCDWWGNSRLPRDAHQVSLIGKYGTLTSPTKSHSTGLLDEQR